MPAFRGINLRSGDLAEQLGVLLLQSFVLVATVPRTEDVGIDVVATLLREYDQTRYIAEDSFFVQIKSASVEEIFFSGDQVNWLKDLHLPLFIATVNRNSAKISLYTTQPLSDALVENPKRNSITLKLKDNYEGDFCDSGETAYIPIGPPILEWTLDSIEKKPDFKAQFYEVVKAHVRLAKNSIETRRVGRAALFTWETGLAPKSNAYKTKPIDDKEVVGELSSPYFEAIISEMIFGDDIGMLRSTYRLLEKSLQAKGHFEIVGGQRQLKPWTHPLAEQILKGDKDAKY